MLRKLRRKRGQNTAEYAVLIALVIGAAIAMQVYVKRALQAKTFDASSHLAAAGGLGAGTAQFEPQYLDSSFFVSRNSDSTMNLGGGDTMEERRVVTNSTTNITRAAGGYQEMGVGDGVVVAGRDAYTVTGTGTGTVTGTGTIVIDDPIGTGTTTGTTGTTGTTTN